MRGLLLTAIVAVLATDAKAQTDTPPYPRIQVVDYSPDTVVPIRGELGYQLMLEFGPEERIENVSIGDSLAWQVTPNRRANILFLKPVDGAATNMTVVTDLRRYVFDLEVLPKGSRRAPYSLRFAYPEPGVAIPVEVPVAPPEPPRVANAAYVIEGSRESAPVRVFDDGRMTYFEYPADGAMPAIFAVASDGSESIVNFVVRGPYVVVDQLAARFALRNGARVATVTNAAYPVETPHKRSRR
jgi:type IV secretion system protein VirB9